jgi:hypothetical protein
VTPRRLLLIATFLAFVNDSGATYKDWFAPFAWVQTVLFEALPYKIRGFDHVTAICLYLASKSSDGKGPRVQPMRKAMLLAFYTLLGTFAYGVVVRGGDFRAASWQIYLILSGLLYAFAVAAAFKTPEHFAQLARVILWAAGYRAAMCVLYWFFNIYGVDLKAKPEFLTTHDDTVLWVVSVLVLFLAFIQGGSIGKRLKLLAITALIFLGIVFNQRRLAWVSLAMGVLMMIALMPPGKPKKRIIRGAFVLAPVLAIYVAVGWGREGRIFAPLKSFQTVTTHEDASTKARNAENLGLIATSNYSSMLMGTGWGHPYVEVTNKFTIANAFPLWQYVPHNSILGLLAFSGVVGFAGYWLMFPTAMFYNGRLARRGNAKLARNVGLIGAAQLVICANQYYGDMGLAFVKPVYMAAISYAIALRLPLFAGAVVPRGTPRPASAERASQAKAA